MSSELKVNKITPESGTTLTLGDSGDSVAFATGAFPALANLTVSGDLTVDTNSLKVDSTNNRVGIGKTNPSTALDVVGTTTATLFAGSGASLTTLNANELDSGTVPDARFPATLPAISGANLTNLDAADLASGTVPTARLGSGTASSTTFLAGDSSFKTVTGTTINNNADDRVITGSGSANTLNGEANLTYDGSKLGINIASPTRTVHIHDDSQPYIHMTNNTTGTTTGDGFDILVDSSSGKAILNNRENQPIEWMTNNTVRMHLDASGNLGIGAAPSQAKLHVIKSDSGALNNNNSNCFMIEDSSAAGMSIGSSNSGEGHIYFGDSDDADVGGLSYYHSDNSFDIRVNGGVKTRIHSSGVISANNGIALGVGTASTASNVLDDYEEGTFTGTIKDSSGASGNQTAVGNYVKIGNQLTVQGQVSLGGATSGTGVTFITMPFACRSDSRGGLAVGLVTGGIINLTNDDKTLNLIPEVGSTAMFLVETDISGTHTHLTFNANYGSSGIFSYSGSYLVD